MAYSKTNWVNGTTPANATNMNKIETELETLDNGIIGTTLYNNSTGTTSSITLSSSIANFSFIKIYGYFKYSTNNETAYFCREYEAINGQNYEVTGSVYSGTTNTFITSQINTITDTTVSRGTAILLKIGDGVERTNGLVYITKIVGFE